MNIIPSTSSLLPAGEPLGSSGQRASPIGEALSLITSGATLKRVTLLAEQPDASVVLVRADYSAAAESLPLSASPAPPKRIAQEPIDVNWTEVDGDSGPSGTQMTAVSRGSGGSAHFNPLWQYTRTQAGFSADPKGVHVDVRV